ncbi:MAG: hypothetical protein GY737_00270 [Desulfobacteraceae bacterium]|nr:hypothetical protein [Desulfobacteraceae bacterium]
MEDLYKLGGDLLPTDNNVKNFRHLFDGYTTGELDGVCVFWTPAGEEHPAVVTMGGEGFRGGTKWDKKCDTIATMWGVYVRPQYRGHSLGFGAQSVGRKTLLEQGFTHCKTEVMTTNEGGKGNWKDLDKAMDIEVLGVCCLATLEE